VQSQAFEIINCEAVSGILWVGELQGLNWWPPSTAKISFAKSWKLKVSAMTTEKW